MFMPKSSRHSLIAALTSVALLPYMAPAFFSIASNVATVSVRRTEASGERHPEALVHEAPSANYQRAGFYGVQLQVKERQVTNANKTLREQIASGVRSLWNRPFKKWVDVINNFLGSFSAATGLSEAIKELKDCLRDELPDEDE
jgi:hypothetical protein